MAVEWGEGGLGLAEGRGQPVGGGGEALDIYTVSTISTQYLHSIYNIYTVSTPGAAPPRQARQRLLQQVRAAGTWEREQLGQVQAAANHSSVL